MLPKHTPEKRKSYQSPVLRQYGDIRRLTQVTDRRSGAMDTAPGIGRNDKTL